MNSLFSSPQRARRLPLALAALALSVAAGAVQAQTAPADSTMVKLIRGLIQSGALNKDAGEALLAQAQSEALAQAQARPAAAPAALAQVQPGDVRVPYISQTVREQIRDDIKGQVMAEAKAGGWAAPNETPAWTKRIRLEGDVRARYESRYYDMANSNIEIDWRSLNSGSGYDVNSNTNLALPALLNTREDRKHLLRARAWASWPTFPTPRRQVSAWPAAMTTAPCPPRKPSVAAWARKTSGWTRPGCRTSPPRG